MSGGDQRRAIIDAGDQLRAGADGEQRLQRRQVIPHRNDGHGVITLIVEKGKILPQP